MVSTVEINNFRGIDNLKVPLSNITILTGANGVGKSSIMEALYCLFSETKLDVSGLPRYDKSVAVGVDPLGGVVQRGMYPYRLFFEELTLGFEDKCSVIANFNGDVWKWNYEKINPTEINDKIAAVVKVDENSMAMGNVNMFDSRTDIAWFDWELNGYTYSRFQQLAKDNAFYLRGTNNIPVSGCKYIDFSSIRYQNKILPYFTEKKLEEGIKLINKNVTAIRLGDTNGGLSIILDESKELTLSMLGTGAVSWLNTLRAILDWKEQSVIKNAKNIPKLVLIDEMGTGVHYSVLVELWEFIAKFIEENKDIQFIFTSHSEDCIKAYCEVFESKTTDANIVSLYKTNRGKFKYVEYKKESFSSVKKGEWEVRA